MDGVAPQPLTLVEKGTLKAFLLTRTPLFKEYPGSNGHARMTGPYGTRSPGFGNLFIRASQTTPAADMKNKLIELCRAANKPYGILIRKLDYPSMGSIGEWERMAQSAGAARPMVPPLLAYKIYPDGREELVRGPFVPGSLHPLFQGHRGGLGRKLRVRYDRFKRALCTGGSGIVHHHRFDSRSSRAV